jgi:hypothetical protein
MFEVIAPGTTNLLISEYPLKALYKTTADYCLLNLGKEPSKNGMASVRTLAFSLAPQNPKPELERLAPRT